MVDTNLLKPGWVLDIAAVEAFLRALGIRADVIDYVKEASRQVGRSDDLLAFSAFCDSWQEHAQQKTAAKFPEQWQALAVLSSYPEAIEKHRQRGIPWEITRATLADFQRDARGEYGSDDWKFNRISWMRNHVSGTFFEIGRLQYVLGTFGYKFRIYRNNGEIISLALPGIKCTARGWMSEEDAAFETVLEDTNSGIIGHPALPNGAISPAVHTIPAASKVLLDADSTVAQIHIPSSGKLDRATCCQSLQSAKVFFEKYFPEVQIHTYCTGTWILDAELQKVLPHSNIADFGRLFHLLTTTNANDRQLRERVFGDAEWHECSAENSLQKAILDHHRNGGEFRSTAGFILPEEIAAFDTINP